MTAPAMAPPTAPVLLTDGAVAGHQRSLGGHLAAHGPMPTRADLIALVEHAALTGRGGAGFPTARKLAAVAAGRRPVVVANGAEGEPASSKDRVLLDRVPHLVLDGLALAATAVGSRETYLFVHGGAAAGLRRAVAERPESPRVVDAPAAFIAGEESAVLQSILGRPARPTSKLPPVYVKGLGGRPTLVLNVETLARLALLARGHVATATRLFSVGGAVARPGVTELPDGSSTRQVLAAAGGPTDVVQAVLLGGYHGAWLPYGPLADLPLTPAALVPMGAQVGAGVLVALPADVCGLAETTRVLRYLADQSAGQCGPCLNGLPALAAAFAELTGHASPMLLRRIEQLCGLVAGRGACHHPDGSIRLARSALRTFDDELHRHLAGGCSGMRAPSLPIGGA